MSCLDAKSIFMEGGETDLDRDLDLDRDRLPPRVLGSLVLKCKGDSDCLISSFFRGSDGRGGKGGNSPEGGGNPLAEPLKGNLGRPGKPGNPEGPGDPGDEVKEPLKSWAAAADTGGMPWIFGSLKPGGKMGVIPAMGLLTNGATGSPFFYASSINCNRGG